MRVVREPPAVRAAEDEKPLAAVQNRRRVLVPRRGGARVGAVAGGRVGLFGGCVEPRPPPGVHAGERGARSSGSTARRGGARARSSRVRVIGYDAGPPAGVRAGVARTHLPGALDARAQGRERIEGFLVARFGRIGAVERGPPLGPLLVHELDEQAHRLGRVHRPEVRPRLLHRAVFGGHAPRAPGLAAPSSAWARSARSTSRVSSEKPEDVAATRDARTAA